MKRIKYESLSLIFIFLLAFTSCAAQTNYWDFELNKNWKIKIDPEKNGFEKKWFEKIDEVGLQEIEVPSFWENEIGFEFDGWVWYFNTFSIPSNLEKVAVKCDAIDDDAIIWINGKEVGRHTGYSESFYFDITDYIRLGDNVITILVEDHGGPGGIYKPIRVSEYSVSEDLLKTKYSDMNARHSVKWINEGIIYEIYPRVFSKEGNFKGITNRLEQLNQLGVTILWLMPINPIGEIKRKGGLGSPYSVRDFYGINSEYGTPADLKELVSKAHNLGLKVIIDVVLNHSAWDNPLANDHPDWYTKNESGKIIPPNSDWMDVADFNYESIELRKYMIEMLKYWISEFDIDGFRCDVSELVPTEFWEEARKELDEIKTIFMLSEGTLPEHHLSAFDMTYSWNVYDNFSGILARVKKPSMITEVIKTEKFMFPKNSLRMRFNENHDKPRAAGFFGNDGAVITSAIIFSLPGVPLIHNGQEIGEMEYSSLFEKGEIDWSKLDGDNKLFRFYQDLISFRKRNSSLVYGSFDPIDFGDEILAYIRSNQENHIISIYNFSNTVKTVDLNFLPEKFKALKPNFNNSFGKKYRIDEIRMGRPANKLIELEQFGFILLELK
ncbi:MAG: hypothetical protein FJ213_04500 [Ignavibacteria bacterium]|nr:hypothetical protein [Ignavibacteria bacterium]